MEKEHLMELHGLLYELEVLVARRTIPAQWNAPEQEMIREVMQVVEEEVRKIDKKLAP